MSETPNEGAGGVSVERQEQAAWVALTNDPSAYTSTRPREVFAHGYRAASVDLHQQLVREHDLLLKERNPEHLGSLAFQLRALIVESEARERELEADRDKARIRAAEFEAREGAHLAEIKKAKAREAVLVEALKEKQAVIDFAAQALRASEQVGGPTVREAWHLAMVALTDAETEKMGQDQAEYRETARKAFAAARSVVAARLLEQPDEGKEASFTVVLRRHGGSDWEVEVRELDGSEFAKVWGRGPHDALTAAVPYMACHGDALAARPVSSEENTDAA